MRDLQRAITAVKKAKKILIGSGAGMGKDSGMPDFRGDKGFWNHYPPYRNKFNFYQCANPSFLLEHPHLFWGFYGHRLLMYRSTKPHQGFNIINKEIQKCEDYFLLTSNVDGHFQKALFPEQKIYQVHGSIHHLQCDTCQEITENIFNPVIDQNFMSCEDLPKCAECKNILRPNILLFNDWDWISDRADLQARKYENFIDKVTEEDNLLILQIGSGTAVPTIRNMCQRVLFSNPASTLIRINPEPSSGSQTDKIIHLEMAALGGLQMLFQQKYPE